MKTIVAVLSVFFFSLESRAVTITVTNNLDAGFGSLRQAIIEVNASVDPANKIQFNIPGGPPVKITLTSAGLPVIAKQVTVDGTTQSGWSSNAAAVILSCPTMIVTGLSLGGPASVIRGLRVQEMTNSSFNSTGIGLITPGHTIAGCQIISNYQGIVINSSSNTIGGVPVSTNRNVISGNVSSGIFISPGAGQNTISGNMIGTDPTGTTPMGNGVNGIAIAASAGNIIGGVSGLETRNVISGNKASGVGITTFSGAVAADRNVIIGNYIGLNAAGSGVITNGGSGVLIASGVSNRVGGTAGGEGNVIAGNVSAGVSVSGTNTFFSVIQGNFIGPSADGISAPPLAGAQQVGVDVQGGSDALIGGSSSAARNTISGNGLYGVRNQLACLRCSVIGNYIGINANGNAALPNAFYGITVAKSTNSAVIGNVISGNNSVAINITLSNTVGLVIQGNLIGTDATGANPVPNNGPVVGAIEIDGANGVLIGGTNSGEGNIIAFNAGRGISVVTNTVAGGVRNSFLGNLIYSNAGFAIDLGINNSTANDVAPDADTGANNLQNFPVVTSVTQGSVQVRGFLVSGTSQTYRCEFFATNVPQGMIFLGATNAVTSSGGTATFSVVFGPTVPTGAVVIATATDASGNTSELGTGAIVKPAVDSDLDGLWDAWETINFGGSLALIGTGDNDGDGHNNYDEFVADTSPTNNGSFFKLVTITNGLPHYPRWVSSVARWYDVEYSTNLLSPDWSILSDNIVGAGGLQSLVDSADATDRVYRVRVKIP